MRAPTCSQNNAPSYPSQSLMISELSCRWRASQDGSHHDSNRDVRRAVGRTHLGDRFARPPVDVERHDVLVRKSARQTDRVVAEIRADVDELTVVALQQPVPCVVQLGLVGAEEIRANVLGAGVRRQRHSRKGPIEHLAPSSATSRWFSSHRPHSFSSRCDRRRARDA